MLSLSRILTAKTRLIVAVLVMVLMTFAAWKVSVAAQGLDAWQACTKDADCIVMPGLCGSSVGVNARYKSEAIEYFSRMAMVSNCMQPDPKSAALKITPTAVCIQNRCEIQTNTKGE